MATIKMNATKIANENGNGMSQSFVTPFNNKDPERYWESRDYAKNIAATALRQIFGSLAEDFGKDHWVGVISSWGCVTIEGKIVHRVIRWREMPAIALRVHGYEHDGWVIVSLNEGADVYEVELADEQFFAIEGSRHEEVYCDGLGSLIDRLVETGDKTKEEYDAQIKASYPELAYAKEHGAQVVYL